LSGIVYPSLKEEAKDLRKVDFNQRIADFLHQLTRTGVTRLLLWEEYKKKVPEGYAYPQFCELLSREKKFSQASMHFQYQPGDMLLVDFAGDNLSYADHQTGEVISCPVLVCVLPFSGYSYVVALANAALPNVIKALNQCLTFFGGVPLNLKSDNMKQIVNKSCRYEPVFTDAMQQWALHNNITLQAARVRKPKDKAPVEAEVKLSYQRIYAPLRDEVFFSLEELNAAILIKLSEHHHRPFQQKKDNRLTHFTELEKPCLHPLPPASFIIHHAIEAKVQKNYHIILGEDWHQYSVPFSFIGKKVQAVYDTDTIEVYYKHERIALHRRSYKRHGYTTLLEHMPEGHKRYMEQKGWDADYFLARADKVGPCCRQYVEKILESRKFTEQTYNACLGILSLEKQYGPMRIEAAAKRALKGRSFNYRTMKDILCSGLDKKEQNDGPDLFAPPLHENVRGPEAYQ
jgi:transposase